jgi:hypothetical protein
MDNKHILKVRPEDKLLFACTRQNFLYAHQKTVLDTCSNEEVRWDVVYAIANVHGVAPLVYSNLLQCTTMDLGIPKDIMDQFKRFSFGNTVRKEKMAEKITEVLSFLNKKSIDVMLIKGAALDVLVYDHSWYTISKDVDFILRAKRDEITDKDEAEIRALRRGLPSESGYFRHHDVDMNGTLPINFQRIWDDATKIKFRGRDVFVMSPEDMLISVCINSCRNRFFRLKSLCDIAEIINKYNGMKWEELTSKAREYDCNNIVYTALLVTKMTLGCELPEEVLDNLTVNLARAAIIRYLSQHMSWSSLSSLYSGRKVFGRRVSLSLLLPYAAYRWYQVWRKLGVVYRIRHPIIAPDVSDFVNA